VIVASRLGVKSRTICISSLMAAAGVRANRLDCPARFCSKTTIQLVFIEQMIRFAEFADNWSSVVNSSTAGKTK
jgi:hypothetical protein